FWVVRRSVPSTRFPDPPASRRLFRMRWSNRRETLHMREPCHEASREILPTPILTKDWPFPNSTHSILPLPDAHWPGSARCLETRLSPPTSHFGRSVLQAREYCVSHLSLSA